MARPWKAHLLDLELLLLQERQCARGLGLGLCLGSALQLNLQQLGALVQHRPLLRQLCPLPR